MKNLVPVVLKALDVLECFRTPDEEITLSDVTARTGISHATAYRILCTLVHRQYLSRRAMRYRLSSMRRKIRVSFCASMSLPLSVAIAESLAEAANQAGIDLTVRDNQFSRDVAMENARSLAAEGIDVAIEFQRDHAFAAPIANVFRSARIPLIAVHVPHPGAIYFGPDNYRAGLSAGAALGRHALVEFAGRPKLLLLLRINDAGTPLQERITGVIDGFRQVLPNFPDDRIVHLDGAGDRDRSKEVALGTLRRLRRSGTLLIAAGSDHSALGALDAVRDLRLTDRCALVGHDGDREALERIAEVDSPFIGTVAFFPERYGQGLIGLVLRLLKGEQIAPFNYVPHEFLTRAGVSGLNTTRPRAESPGIRK